VINFCNTVKKMKHNAKSPQAKSKTKVIPGSY
jgi:hypothetical protein